MWQPFPSKSKDSDQSISDEEDEDCPWPENAVSLAGTFDRKKENLGVASQLDLLKEFQPLYGSHKFAVSLHRRPSGFSSEEEVEVPEFCNQSNIIRQCNVEVDSISLKRDESTREPDEHHSSVQKGRQALLKSDIDWDDVSDMLNFDSRGKQKLTECSTQSVIYKDKTGLNPSTETGRWPSHNSLCLKEKTPSKGGRRKSVARQSSHVESFPKGVLWSSVQTDKGGNSTSSDELQDEAEAFDDWPKEKTNHTEASDGGMSKPRLTLPIGAIVQRDDSRCSMVELLDHLQGRNSKPYLKCKPKERIKRHGVNRNLPSSGSNLMSDEDAGDCGESMNSGSSTDNEDIAKNPRPDIAGSARKTMADKFQEAFGSTPVLDRRSSFMAPKLSSTGIFGRLQHVMQWQKEQDTEFLKKQQTEVWPKDEARCIDVKILSRSFDAKLTVCHCSLLENEESSVQNPQQESFGKTWTIIFNSRVCGDVDLEMGNLIRIHPPWKEVQVLHCGEIIILATYFSEI